MMNHSNLPILTPPYPQPRICTTTAEAINALEHLYNISTAFLHERFLQVMQGNAPEAHFSAYYPALKLTISSHATVDSRLAYGRVSGPGVYCTTLTRPDLFRTYLQAQIETLMKSYGVSVTVDVSDVAIPLHFALPEGTYIDPTTQANLSRPLRDIFDTPDLSQTDDRIVNGESVYEVGDILPLAPFTAPRVDYSLHRLSHYTATRPQHFQNFVLFTNYQFYVDEFIHYARETLQDESRGYTALVEPGNLVTLAGSKGESVSGQRPTKSPQMPAYHLTRPDHSGITLVNIGVGPSNAKTITDHIAVLRPHTWLMLGHCAGLRKGQSLGDYVLAHAYLREDHVLDEDLPLWVPIPALAEVQVALEEAVAEVTQLSGYELKRLMRTGTVATIDNRNWELREQSGPIKRLSQSRAIGLDMESATIAANGFRFRVPYGTLLCVSDKPLHGELKLPGMATEFYNRQVAQHLHIGILALEKLREMPPERLHSRKLRAFDETAFQ